MTSVTGSVEPVEMEVKAKENVTLGVECIDSGETSSQELTKLPVVTTSLKKISILEPISEKRVPVKVAVPRKHYSDVFKEVWYDKKPLVLATHLVPSLPIELFEIFAGIIEKSTDTPVVLIHESRIDRPVASSIVDIAFLSADSEWKEGTLLPVGIVFEHRFNKTKTPGVYADIVIAQDVAQNVEDILDLRGHNIAVPDRHRKVGTAGVLFNHLRSKGENPSFFGNILDSGTQLAALQMVAGKQTDIGILEAPVINCNKHDLPGVSGVLILDSFGPLPPYQITLNSKLSQSIGDSIKNAFLSANSSPEWLARLSPFGVTGFSEYSKDNYDVEDMKLSVTSVRYY